MRKLITTALVASLVSVPVFGAKVSFSLDVDAISTTEGSPIYDSGLLVLIVDTAGDGFQSPVSNTIVTGDDQIVTTWDLSIDGSQNPGVQLTSGAVDYGVDWEAGDPLALVWFPNLDSSNPTPSSDEPYGFFSDKNNFASGHSWLMPPAGALHSLKLLTSSATTLVTTTGDVPAAVGKAGYAVGQAIAAVAAPTDLTLVVSGTAINVSWTVGSAAGGGYIVQRKKAGTDQWYSVGFADSTDSNFTDANNVEPGATYDYRLVSFSGYDIAASVSEVIQALRSRIIAFDSRAKMMTGVNKRTIDLSVTGSEELPVLLQAIGPSLHATNSLPASRPIPADTALELYYGIKPADVTDRLIASNDEWDLYEDVDLITDLMTEYGAYPMYNHPGIGDAAFLALVKEVVGGYTTPVFDPLGSEGIAVVGIYDVDYLSETPSDTRLTGVASRGFVGAGFENMRSSINIVGPAPMKLLVRAQGPWLRDLAPNDQFSSETVLDNPTMTFNRLVNGQWVEVATNNDWGVANSATTAEIQAAADTVGLPRLTEGSADAALLLTVEPGIYQAIVDGVDGENGVAQIAIFEVPAD